jgi:hypothetical protein
MTANQSPEAAGIAGWERTLKDAFELWITPEYERRKTAALIGQNFRLSSAQVLFSDEGAPLVRFNEEVRGVIQVRAARAVNAGDPVLTADIADFVGMELLKEERDYGHFTLIQHHDKWVMLFDFSRNRAHASDLINLAAEFISVAEHCLAAKFPGPFIDNLFSACELLAKARLITVVLRKGSRSHGHIHSRINSWRKLGNVGGEFVDLFNQLSTARGGARYQARFLDGVVVESSLQIARKEAEVLRARVAPKIAALAAPSTFSLDSPITRQLYVNQ